MTWPPQMCLQNHPQLTQLKVASTADGIDMIGHGYWLVDSTVDSDAKVDSDSGDKLVEY